MSLQHLSSSSIKPHARTTLRALSSTSRGLGKVPLLITPKQLSALPKATTKILDVSWHMPNLSPPRNPTTEYLLGPRIPSSIRWDLDLIATPKPSTSTSSTSGSSPSQSQEDPSWLNSGLSENPLGLGHMLPSPKRFAQACEELGIGRGDHVVLYDSVGVFSAPRGAWTFDTMGHAKVSVLDGGLPRWKAEGYEVDTEKVEKHSPFEKKGDYPVPGLHRASVKSYEEIVEQSEKGGDKASDLIFDARSRERWSGSAPEPRPGLSSGHMPHSFSLPFTSLLSPFTPSKPYSSFLPLPELLQTILKALSSPSANLNPGQDLSDEDLKRAKVLWEEVKRGRRGVSWTCGSGMTACVGVWGMRVLAEAEEEGERMRLGVYDESWTGYALRKQSKIVKGDR